MRAKLIVLVVMLVLVAGAGLFIARLRSRTSVRVTLHLAVTPAERSGFVAGVANSAKFKYLMGKQAGVMPGLAQKLSVEPVPNSPLLEARLGVLTKDEGARYVASFLETLQMLCQTQAQVSLADHSIR